MTRWLRRVVVPVVASGLGVVGLAAAGAGPAAAQTWAMSQSNNWSGYNVGILDKGTPITGVTATWTVPTASAHQPQQDEFSSMWIGIGGGCVNSGCSASDATLIQVGTEQDVASDGSTSYSAWWETIPAPSVTAFSVRPGDQMYASISQGPVPETWNVTIQDKTSGQSFNGVANLPMAYSSDFTTAEFILETPVVTSSSGAAIGTMPDLASPQFDLATINGASAALAPADEIQLINGSGTVEATPSAPDSDADGFAVCTWSGSCATPGTS